MKTTVIAGAGAALPLKSLAAAALEPAPSPLDASASTVAAADYTRGIGHYPGAPGENFSPTLVLDTTTYRNLALLRPAFHSSSYDYNLTAQLITDGIKDTHLPTWVSTSVDGVGILPKQDREGFLDHSNTNTMELKGATPFVQIELGGGESVPVIDRIGVFVIVPEHVDANTLAIVISTSDDGRAWKQVAKSGTLVTVSPASYPPDMVAGGHLYYPLIALDQPSQSRYYRVQYHAPAAAPGVEPWVWQAGQIAFYKGEQRIQLGGPYTFTSAWMSAGLSEEWVYVDLGARCTFDRVTLSWIARAAEGSLQISDDAENWHTVQPLPSHDELVDDIKLSTPQQARYVRVFMTRPSSEHGYILSELEVFGRGGPVAQPKPALAPVDGKLDLAGGAWRVQRSSFITADGPPLAQPGFKDDTWVVATVPGTTLTSYLNVEAIPDPDYGRNQLYVSDSYFYSDFWYRTEFTAPALAHGEIAWLNSTG